MPLYRQTSPPVGERSDEEPGATEGAMRDGWKLEWSGERRAEVGNPSATFLVKQMSYFQ